MYLHVSVYVKPPSGCVKLCTKNVENLRNNIEKGDIRIFKNIMFIYYIVIIYKNNILYFKPLLFHHVIMVLL
jgi:hypothetical protein